MNLEIELDKLLEDLVICARNKKLDNNNYFHIKYKINLEKSKDIYKKSKKYIKLLRKLINYKNQIDKKIQDEIKEDLDFEEKQIESMKRNDFSSSDCYFDRDIFDDSDDNNTYIDHLVDSNHKCNNIEEDEENFDTYIANRKIYKINKYNHHYE